MTHPQDLVNKKSLEILKDFQERLSELEKRNEDVYELITNFTKHIDELEKEVKLGIDLRLFTVESLLEVWMPKIESVLNQFLTRMEYICRKYSSPYDAFDKNMSLADFYVKLKNELGAGGNQTSTKICPNCQTEMFTKRATESPYYKCPVCGWCEEKEPTTDETHPCDKCELWNEEGSTYCGFTYPTINGLCPSFKPKDAPAVYTPFPMMTPDEYRRNLCRDLLDKQREEFIQKLQKLLKNHVEWECLYYIDEDDIMELIEEYEKRLEEQDKK